MSSRGLLLVALLLAAGRPGNFGVVQSGAIYRGAQPSTMQVLALHRDLQVRTMIKLNRGNSFADRAAARLAGVALIEIPLDPEKVGTGDPETAAAVEKALRALTDPKNAPVFLYCAHGRDRTGYVVALHRTRQGWPLDAILRELAAHGHGRVPAHERSNILRAVEREVRRRDAK